MMSSQGDAIRRLAILEQRIARLELACANLPVSSAGSGNTVTVHAAYSGSVGDCVKCVAGTWSAFIASDQDPDLFGIVIRGTSGFMEIAIAGPIIGAGTPGTPYYAPAVAGPPSSTMGASSVVVCAQASPQLRMIGASGGGGVGWPIDEQSPNGDLSFYANVDNTQSIIELQAMCGAQAKGYVAPDGAASYWRAIGCDGNGFALTPSGVQQISVTNPGQPDEQTTPIGSPMGSIEVKDCVDGVTKTLHLFGYEDP